MPRTAWQYCRKKLISFMEKIKKKNHRKMLSQIIYMEQVSSKNYFAFAKTNDVSKYMLFVLSYAIRNININTRARKYYPFIMLALS